MRFLPILIILFLAVMPLKAQEYFIYGPGQVECGLRYNYWIIEPNVPVTEWSLFPASGGFIEDVGTNGVWVTFVNPGFYYLIATSINADSIYFSDTLEIFVYGGQEIEIEGCYDINVSTDCYEVCAFSKMIFLLPNHNSEVSITGAESYSYISQDKIEVTWGPAGYGYVTTFELCNKSLCFNILPEPHADFKSFPSAISDTLTVCRDQEIVFENNSLYASSYLWSFGDGNESDHAETTHSFKTEGYYNVILTAKSTCCQSEKTLVVNVLPSPAPVLDCVNSVCPESRQHYSLIATDCSTFSWTVSNNGTIVNGGGAADDFIDVIWHDGPEGIIELAVSDCVSEHCDASNIFRVPVITSDGPIEGDASVCSGQFATYSVPYFPGVEYNWQMGPHGSIVGDKNRHSIAVQWMKVNAVTASTVSVEYDNCFLECGGSDLLPVIISPAITISGSNFACQNSAASILATAGFDVQSPVYVQWQIQDKSGNILHAEPGLSSAFTHTFSYPAGIYQWVAINSSPDYCNEIMRQDIEVIATPEMPLGIIGEDTICAGVEYGYTIEAAGNYQTLWTVNNGTSTFKPKGQSFNYTFGNTPPHIISARHANIQFQECVSEPVTLPLTLVDNIKINGSEKICLHETTTYSVTYINGSEYNWEIIPADAGEIKESGLSTIEVFWTKAGTATVRLNLCGITFDKNIIIDPLPVFTIEGSLGVCPGETVLISTNQPGFSHSWFNDADINIGNANSIILSAGTYSVELTDANGCGNKASFTIENLPEPVAHLTTPDPLVSCDMIATGVEILANTDPNINSFTWFKDDVTILTGGPVFNVPDFGTYHVAVTNEHGCSALSADITFINCCPVESCGGAGGNCPNPACDYDEYTSFGIDINNTQCQSRSYRFIDPSSVETGNTRWVISSATLGVIHIEDVDILNMEYDYPGYYTLQVISRLTGFPYSSTLCGHYMYFNDKVPAVANFRNTGQCRGAAIEFEDQSLYLPDETIMSWNWDFDDPSSGALNISSVQNPVHVFNNGGLYNVSLTITMLSGCISTKSIQVLITDGPDLDPVYDTIYCEGEAQSFSVDEELFDVLWDFNDPSSGLQNQSGAANASHTFELPGIYNITIAGSDEYNCRSQETFAVDIKSNLLSGNIDVDPSNLICLGDTAILTSPPAGVSWLWSNGETMEKINVPQSDQYSVILRDINHCTYSTPSEFINVYQRPVVTIKGREIYGDDIYGPWLDSLFLCEGDEYFIHAFSSGNPYYEWLDGSPGELQVFTYEGGNLPVSGIHIYGVTASNTLNCLSDTAFFKVTITPLPDKPIIALLSGSGCSHNDNHLQITNPQSGVVYEWSDGQTGTNIITQEPGIIYVTGVTDSGCIDQSSNYIIKPSANIDQLPGGCHIKCDPLALCLPAISMVTSYNLFQNNILIESGSIWPDEIILTEDGSYTIEVTTTNGCTATSEPLDIELYTGVGSITVVTYLDLDHDGLITTADVLLPGIPVEISSNDGLHTGMTNTSLNGEFIFEEYPLSSYTAYFNTSLLSSEWRIVIDSVQTNISTCDDSVIVSLLLAINCTVTGNDLYFESCPGESVIVGDSMWTDAGQYEVHLLGTSGCDSVFMVNIVWPDSIDVASTVWVDVDHNGIISALDTVIAGITIVVDAMINQAPFIDITDINGFANGEYPSRPYLISVDSTLLPAGFTVVHGVDFISDTICGEQTFNFLLVQHCSDVITIIYESLCEGDSILIGGEWIYSDGLHSFTNESFPCDSILDVYVIYYPELSASSSLTWNCIDLGSIDVTPVGIGPFQYEWGHTIEDINSFTGLEEGNYTVTITDVHGCNVAESIIINAPDPSHFYIEPYHEINQGDSLMLIVTGDVGMADSYTWTYGEILSCDTCESTMAFPQINSIVNIQITDINKCTYSLLTQISVLPATIDTTITDNLYIPNVFTPNGDGINDEFALYSRHPDAHLNELEIFDRWGNMLYAATDLPLENLRGWDGTFRNQEMNPQVFAYKANVTLADGRNLILYGNVTLVR